MRPPDDFEVAAWLAKAASDLRMAHLAAGRTVRLWDQVCFHAQQAAEKCLKAVLVALELEVPRTHDLVYLLQCLGRAERSVEKLVEKAAPLGQYGVASRYPNFVLRETQKDALGALALASLICRWSCRQLGTEDITRLRLSPVERKNPARRKPAPRKTSHRKR